MFKKISGFNLLFIIALMIISIAPALSEVLEKGVEELKYNEEIYDTLDFDELVSLSEDEDFYESIKDQVDFVLNNAVVDNSINQNPEINKHNEILGDYIRVASWNIERGMNLDEIIDIFNNPSVLTDKIKKENPKKLKSVASEISILKNADIIFLTEVDAGMPRTKYRKVAKEFAEAINFNYAYAVEFLEIDPAHLGLEDYKWSEERVVFGDNPPPIYKDKYRGLHGSAILSKFPLNNVRVLRYPKVYDWYNGEKIRIGQLEKFKRITASKFFNEDIIREIRFGSRMAIIADINIPGFKDPVTLIATHLENRTTPHNRKKQLQSLLKTVKEKENPVILAGDFNTATADAAPHKTKKINQKHKHFILRHCFFYNIPKHYVIDPVMSIPNTLRKHDDPTVKSLPVFSSNPERGLFNLLRKFKFEDGYHFDFRSTPGKYSGRGGTLANSNKRAFKGFVATFMRQRPLYVGKFKLDWLFVKPYIKKANCKDCSFKFAPHFGKTLFDLNYAFKESISDHAAITVDIPLQEPVSVSKKEAKHIEKEEHRLEELEEKEYKRKKKQEKHKLHQEKDELKKEVKKNLNEENIDDKD